MGNLQNATVLIFVSVESKATKIDMILMESAWRRLDFNISLEVLTSGEPAWRAKSNIAPRKWIQRVRSHGMLTTEKVVFTGPNGHAE